MHRAWKIDMSWKSTKSRKLLFSFRCSFIKVRRRKSIFRLKRILARWTRIKMNNLSVNLVALNYVCVDMLLTFFSRAEFKIHSELKTRKSQSGKSFFIDNDDNNEDGDECFLAFHYSFKVLWAALGHWSNHLQTHQSLNEKRIIAARNATLMKSKWQRSEEEKNICFIFEPCQWIDRILITWESILILLRENRFHNWIFHLWLKFTISRIVYVECWASDNNDWCLHSGPIHCIQWPNTNYKCFRKN